MNRSRNPFSVMFDRRRFCNSIAMSVAGVFVARLSPAMQLPELAIDDQEYFVCNGWVLSRADVATMELSADAIRLQ